MDEVGVTILDQARQDTRLTARSTIRVMVVLTDPQQCPGQGARGGWSATYSVMLLISLTLTTTTNILVTSLLLPFRSTLILDMVHYQVLFLPRWIAY